MAERVSIRPLRTICRRITRSIWSGTAIASATGAKQIGQSTYKVVDSILTSRRVEQQSYRSCMGLLKLADKYSAHRLEAACTQALSYTASPSYKSVKSILSAYQKHPDEHLEKATHKATGITRGADFYRRKSND